MQKLRIIGLMGKSKSGKNTAGAILTTMGAGQELAFANKLKAICGELFELSYDDMYTEEGKSAPTKFDAFACPACTSVEVKTEVVDRKKLCVCKVCGTVGEPKPFASKWTPRTILQFVGTECFRRISPDVWVNFVLKEATRLQREGAEFIVVTDCRFRSEAEAIWKAGGEVWKIRRPEVEKQQTGIKGHASETEQDSIGDHEVQAVIMNDSTLDVLRDRLEVAFKRFTEKTAQEEADGAQADHAVEA